MVRAMLRLLRGLLLALTALSCGDPQGPTIEDAPHQGEVFPVAPLSFAWPTGPYALLSNNGSDTLSVVDLRERRHVGFIPAGLNPVDNDGPHHLAYDRARGKIYVALSYPPSSFVAGPHAAHGSSVTPGKVLQLDAATGQLDAVMRADDNPGDIVLSDDGGRLVVSHFDLAKAVANLARPIEAQRASLLLYDPADFRASAAPRSFPVCVAPHGVALGAGDGRFAYVACYGEDSLAVVDLAATDAAQAVVRVPVGPAPQAAPNLRYGPYAAVLTPDGQRVLVGDTEGRDLRVFDVASGAMTTQVYAAGGAVFFPAASKSGQRLAVPVQTPDFIALVEPSPTGSLVEVLRRSFPGDECRRPHEALFWDDDRELLLVCEGDHVKPGKLLFLDPGTLDVRGSVELGVYPDKAVVVTP